MKFTGYRVQLFNNLGKRIDEFITPSQDPKQLLDILSVSHPSADAFKVRVEDCDGHGFWMLIGERGTEAK